MKRYTFGLAVLAGMVTIAAVLVLLGVDPVSAHALQLYAADAGAAAAVTVKDLEAVTAKLKEVTDKFNGKSDELAKQAEAAMTEVKDKGKLVDETKAQVDKMLVEHTVLTKEKNELEAKLAETQARLTGVEQEVARRPGGRGVEASRTIGAQLTADEKFKEFAAAGSGARGKFRFSVNAAVTSVDYPVSEPSIVGPQVVPGTLPTLKQRLFVRDLIPVGQTGQPAIFWVKQTGFTNNARVVTEGTLKPTSTIAYDGVMTPVTTIAHLFKASKQILADFKQLRTDVDRELRYGLKYVEEQEILLGDGTGIHLEGIVPQATAFDSAIAGVIQNHNRIDDIRIAILQAQLARLPSTGIVMHFLDWARIELTKDENGQYVFANPLRLAGNTLWGLPVVPTEIDDFENNFLTGAFQGGAQIYDREEMNVEIATENNDDFEKNMITMRCEERVALAVFRPEAFIYGPFTNPT